MAAKTLTAGIFYAPHAEDFFIFCMFKIDLDSDARCKFPLLFI